MASGLSTRQVVGDLDHTVEQAPEGKELGGIGNSAREGLGSEVRGQELCLSKAWVEGGNSGWDFVEELSKAGHQGQSFVGVGGCGLEGGGSF